MVGNHWSRFGDIRRVRLSNQELRTLSAARSRIANYSYVLRVILRDAVRSLHLTRAVGRAAWLVITGIDSETSDASACRMQRSELGLILELGLPNYSYCSSHLQGSCHFTHVTRAVEELQSSYRRQCRSIGGVRLLHPRGLKLLGLKNYFFGVIFSDIICCQEALRVPRR